MVCQSGVWKKQFNGTLRRVQGEVGNLAGDGSFAACNDDEVVVGGGGYCTPWNPGNPNLYPALIASWPAYVGETIWPTGITATKNGWVADCNGQPPNGGIAVAYVACMKP